MSIIDIILIIVCIAAAVRGWRAGFFRQGAAVVGFIAGLFVGAMVAPSFAQHGSNHTMKAVITIAIIFAIAIALSFVGDMIGILLSRIFRKFHLDIIDHLGGVILGVAATLFTAWFLVTLLASGPFYQLNNLFRQSAIMQDMNSTLGSPPLLFSQLSKILKINGFPQVFIGLEPPNGPPVIEPGSQSVKAVAIKDQTSVVKIVGYGCGGMKEGSGFIVAPNEVVTNAHVVSGIAHPYIISKSGQHTATVVLYNPNLDLAIMKTHGLTGLPIPVNHGVVKRGKMGAVLGYPAGGPYTAGAGAVLNEVNARGLNIYGSSVVDRSIYTLQAHVIPGNSGGPFVDTYGTVEGVVFATSTSQKNVGYALTSQEIIPDIQQAAHATHAVSTERCSE